MIIAMGDGRLGGVAGGQAGDGQLSLLEADEAARPRPISRALISLKYSCTAPVYRGGARPSIHNVVCVHARRGIRRVMTSVRIQQAHELAPAAVTHDRSSDRVLEACSVAGMVGVLHQLGQLAAQAHEIFEGLTAEATRSARRVTALQERLASATDRRARVDDALLATDPDELSQICTATPGVEFRAPVEEQSGLFTPASRPPSLQAIFEAARPSPRLDLLDRFVVQKEGGNRYAKYGLHDTCASGYSDKHFFLKMWLDEEERKMEVLKAVRAATPTQCAPCAAPRETRMCRLHIRLMNASFAPPMVSPRSRERRWLMAAVPCRYRAGAQGAPRRAPAKGRCRGGRRPASKGKEGGKEEVPDRGGEAGPRAAQHQHQSRR